MQKFKGTIYQAINIQNEKSYIGKTVQSFNEYKENHIKSALRKDDLKNNIKGKHFYNAIRKYNPENFKWVILGEIESYNIFDLNEKLSEAEIESIWVFKTFGSDGIKHDNIYGYNQTKGGDGIAGYKFTDSQLMVLKISRKQSYIINPLLALQHSNDMKKYYENTLNREKTIRATKEGWSNKEVREQSSESHKQYWENLDEDSYNKRCQTVKDSWTEERKKEWSTQVKNEYSEEKRISWNKNNSECFSDETMRKLSNASLGKNNPRYNIVEYKFLIIKYFEGLHMNEILFHYEKLYNKNIKGRIYNRFLEVLNFPTNCISKYAMKKAREDYKNFIEENKHKIQWYIDNYEKLEEEYFYNNRKYK